MYVVSAGCLVAADLNVEAKLSPAADYLIHRAGDFVRSVEKAPPAPPPCWGCCAELATRRPPLPEGLQPLIGRNTDPVQYPARVTLASERTTVQLQIQSCRLRE